MRNANLVVTLVSTAAQSWCMHISFRYIRILLTTRRCRYSIPSSINEEGRYIPDSYALSDINKAYIFLTYPRMRPHSNTIQWTVSHALDIADVTGPQRDEILNATSPDQIRQKFIKWNAEEEHGDHNQSASFILPSFTLPSFILPFRKK